jgi:hypothetical protein
MSEFDPDPRTGVAKERRRLAKAQEPQPSVSPVNAERERMDKVRARVEAPPESRLPPYVKRALRKLGRGP